MKRTNIRAAVAAAIGKPGTLSRMGLLIASLMALALLLIPAIGRAGHEDHDVKSYTGCLNATGGTLYNIAQGDAPKAACRADQSVVHLSGGDITEIVAGPGLTGGGQNGKLALAVSFAGSGTAATAARSDHTHPAAARRWVSPHWEAFSSETLRAETTVTVLNPSSGPLEVSVNLYDQDGRPERVASTVLSVPAGGARTYETPIPSGTNASGWLEVVAAEPVLVEGGIFSTRFGCDPEGRGCETRAQTSRTLTIYQVP